MCSDVLQHVCYFLSPPTILNFCLVFRNPEIKFGYLKPKKSGKIRNPGKNPDFLEIDIDSTERAYTCDCYIMRDTRTYVKNSITRFF